MCENPWLIHFWELDAKWIFVALPFGFLIMLLFYYDHVWDDTGHIHCFERARDVRKSHPENGADLWKGKRISVSLSAKPSTQRSREAGWFTFGNWTLNGSLWRCHLDNQESKWQRHKDPFSVQFPKVNQPASRLRWVEGFADLPFGFLIMLLFYYDHVWDAIRGILTPSYGANL
jgi:hypothetical protein